MNALEQMIYTSLLQMTGTPVVLGIVALFFFVLFCVMWKFGFEMSLVIMVPGIFMVGYFIPWLGLLFGLFIGILVVGAALLKVFRR